MYMAVTTTSNLKAPEIYHKHVELRHSSLIENVLLNNRVSIRTWASYQLVGYLECLFREALA